MADINQDTNQHAKLVNDYDKVNTFFLHNLKAVFIWRLAGLVTLGENAKNGKYPGR